ncbi:HD domain-containing protein [Allosaccharopolyspora coralli]|uniref:HD domain-containing protein n=1 Tax=Allosaccharopolyspora coralli TaxID=2665642 RepID=A0A5Q3QI56_9PSEU|nr:HD domain-containing protein [Allosaccharopolyspora coralli]QGK71195.1 HD domain-containing protein [Allosaccharopolyspora coralli]
MTTYSWAFGLAQSKLADVLPRRWAHVQGVARQARELRSIAGDQAELLETAAVLHDIGYAPDIAVTGFHPLDGAVFLGDAGASDRLVHLVAHHSYAALEADLRGLSQQLKNYDDEGGLLRDALWYCDLSTTPHGQKVDARARIAEIQDRYGPDHLVTEFITKASPELLAAVDRTQVRLDACEALS